MTESSVLGVGLVLDCADPERLATFWAAALVHVRREHVDGQAQRRLPRNGGGARCGCCMGRASLRVRGLAHLRCLAVPHVGYHAAHPADALSGTARLGNLVLLTSGLVAAAVLAWGAGPTPAARV